MKTNRFIDEKDAKYFFSTSINTMEDAIGTGIFNIKKQSIMFDFNATLLLRFDGMLADTEYPINQSFFVDDFNLLLERISNDTHSEKSEYSFIRNVLDQKLTFDIKITIQNEDVIELTLICFEKLLETEEQLALFSKVVGSGLSLFKGSTFWIDYDKHSDYFFSSDVGPSIMGMDVNEDKLYSTKEFQVFREKSRIVSEIYEASIGHEIEAYESIRRKESDYLGARTPAVTNDDKIVWVEAYGKCILRYKDGSPRFFVAIDIYMSEIYEEKSQLELLTTLIDYGLVNSDVGVWYHQRHFLDGKYYFTDSYQKLMSTERVYKDDSITSILDEQIDRMIEDGNGYEEYLHEFRKVHNSIYTEGVNKYHLVIPNYKNKNTFNWIEVRGTVIERNEKGQVVLFVGVNVDVTESYLRNRELERLRIENEQLQLAENLAIKARELMVWYHYAAETETNRYIFGNEIFEKKLGIRRNKDGLIKISALRKSLVSDDEESEKAANELREFFKNIYRRVLVPISNITTKHRNFITGETMYIEHSVEISDTFEDGRIKLIGGVMLDVTQNVEARKQIRYLADYDTLSNVYNRNYFEKYISEHLPKNYTIMIFDLDGLKLVNDVFGHIAGDNIIKKISEFLKEVFHDGLFISRIGGDEFAVLISETDRDYVTQKFDLFDSVIKKYNETAETELNVSKGSKSVRNNDIPFDKAFVQAENIMYRRKLNNRSSRKSKVLESILETLNAKTEETKEHSERLSTLAVKTMKELGMTRSSEVEDMKLLARVHDIGKITIDDLILKKPSKLTSEEFELVKKHSEAGYKIIRNITDSDDVCNGVLLHHERWDGNGYPQGLKGESIPIFARIISVVDSFDAMTNDRIYHPALTEQEAIKEIKDCSGTQFDPKVVAAFIKACFN